jgi:large subunit ribosomal protein L35
MQKLKTRRSAAKRYKRSASGKFTRKNAFKGHILGKKSSTRKRRLSRRSLVSNNGEIKAISKMLPY